MRECCIANAEARYQQLAADRGWSENPHVTRIVRYAMEAHKDLAALIDRNSLAKVANIKPPASAAVIEEPCAQCRGSICLIIVSAPWLLSIWRFLSLYLSLIERWTSGNGKLRIRVRAPTDSDRREHDAIVYEYFSGEPVHSISLSAMFDRHAQGQQGANEPFYDAIRMGQLWVFLHELSHCKPHEAFGVDVADRKRLKRRIKYDLVDEDLGPISERKWVEELLADGIALNLLFQSTQAQLAEDHSAAQAVERAMIRSLAGVAAAINSIWVLETVGISSGAGQRLSTSTHPPAALRYHRAVQEITFHSPSLPDDAYMYVARLIGDIGRQFW